MKTTSRTQYDTTLLHRIAAIVQRVVPRNDDERRTIEEFIARTTRR